MGCALAGVQVPVIFGLRVVGRPERGGPNHFDYISIDSTATLPPRTTLHERKMVANAAVQGLPPWRLYFPALDC